jgi:small subunit ribosomal protein S17
MESKRNSRRVLEGVVVSNKMKDTVTVEVNRKVRHSVYDKLIARRKKYYAHDPSNSIEMGTKVKIMESKPFSKMKRWIVIN